MNQGTGQTNSDLMTRIKSQGTARVIRIHYLGSTREQHFIHHLFKYVLILCNALCCELCFGCYGGFI